MLRLKVWAVNIYQLNTRMTPLIVQYFSESTRIGFRNRKKAIKVVLVKLINERYLVVIDKMFRWRVQFSREKLSRSEDFSNVMSESSNKLNIGRHDIPKNLQLTEW